MAWRQRLPRGGLVSSGSAIVAAFALAPARNLGGTAGVDADSGMHQRHLKVGGSCAWFVVRGRQVWFSSPTS